MADLVSIEHNPIDSQRQALDCSKACLLRLFGAKRRRPGLPYG